MCFLKWFFRPFCLFRFVFISEIFLLVFSSFDLRFKIFFRPFFFFFFSLFIFPVEEFLTQKLSFKFCFSVLFFLRFQGFLKENFL